MNPDDAILDAMNDRIAALDRIAREADLESKKQAATAAREKKARDAELNRLRGARDLLMGKRTQSKKSKKRGAKPGEAPTTTQEEVRSVMLKLVASNPGIQQSDLVELAKAKLQEVPGRDLRGYPRRVEEVLHDTSEKRQFAIDADGSVALVIDKQPHRMATGSLQADELEPAVDRFGSTRITS